VTVLDWQMDIYDRLRTGLPNTPVHLEGISENDEHPRDPTGLIKPFLIIWYGQLTDITSFTGTVGDLCGTEDSGGNLIKQGNFLVETVAPTGLALLQLENLVRALLTGFRPAGEGELSETGQTTIRDPLPTGIGDTLRFYKPLFFQGVVTTTPVAVPVVPTPMRSTPTRMTLPVGTPVKRDVCAQGHELTGTNLIEERRGGDRVVRRCRTCVNAKARDNYARRKASAH
jgi:hypothetical protein